MIKLANNLTNLVLKQAAEQPGWWSTFGSQLAEPFTGAANYWSGGRVGSEYADDSTWLDTVRRVRNAAPGTNKVPLYYQNDKLLDAAAISTGVAGLAGAGAGAAAGGIVAAPTLTAAGTAIGTAAGTAGTAIASHTPAALALAAGGIGVGSKLLKRTGRFVFAPHSGRPRGLTGSSRVGNQLKRVITPAVTATSAVAVNDLVHHTANGYDLMDKRRQELEAQLVQQGVPQTEAVRLAQKGTWGSTVESLKHYALNPKYYAWDGGGTNPIDQGFAKTMHFSALPSDAYTAARQGLGAWTSAPWIAPLKGAVQGGVNVATSVGLEGPAAIDEYEANHPSLPPNAGLFAKGKRMVGQAQEVVGSRYRQHMQQYFGLDSPHLLKAYNALRKATPDG